MADEPVLSQPAAFFAADVDTSIRKVWLLSAYHTGSHAAWATGFQRHSRHQVTRLTLSGRFWKWRMQGGAVELAAQARRLLAAGNVPDVVLATDMVNLAVWAGLMRDVLPTTPLVCYMHENQLTYPWPAGESRDLTYAIINWMSQLVADRVLFNSHYHLESWFEELPRLLKHYPDYNHLELVKTVRARSHVVPVGIEIDPAGAPRPASVLERASPAPLILWNQRWEYDKRPDRFFDLLYRLDAAGIAFRLAVAGENFRNVPSEFEEARQRLAQRIVQWGFLPSRDDYRELLAQTDVVISTADHEFFGISMLEAIAAGAYPLLPARLSYPELIPQELHATCLYTDDDDLWRKAVELLTTPSPAPPALREHVARSYGWPVAAHQLDEWLARAGLR